MAIEITGEHFSPKYVRRFVQRQFEKEGLVFGEKNPEISKRLKREGGASLAHVTLFLKSGMKLKLGIKFGIKAGKIQPNSKGIIYSAKLNASMIPLSRAKGQDYDWTGFIRKIADFVQKKEEKQVSKPPTVSKAKATDNRVPNTYKAKLEAKRTEIEEKKKALKEQQKLLADQNAENEKLESEIEEFKKVAA